MDDLDTPNCPDCLTRCEIAGEDIPQWWCLECEQVLLEQGTPLRGEASDPVERSLEGRNGLTLS